MEKQPKKQFNDLVPRPTELLYFAESFDTYAKEVLPSHLRSRRTPSSRAPTSTSSQPWNASPQNASTPMGSSKVMAEASPSTSTVSSTSHRTSSAAPSSKSSNSIPLQHTVKSAPPRKEAQSPIPITGQIFERLGTRGKEYVNDRQGTILSPPMVKNTDASAPRPKRTQIGRHTITLTATEVFVNHYPLHMNDYEMGGAFLRTLEKHPDKVDDLVQALRQGLEDWEGIPGWVVLPTGVAVQQGGSAVRNA